MRGLEGKNVIVTGGTSGIGEATVRRFLDEGARVVAFGHRADECAAARRALTGLLAAIPLDVADPQQVADAFARADELFAAAGDPQLHVLINNAGISIRHPFLEIEPADWERVIAVNLNGMFFCAQQAGRRMAERGGAILMTASTNGIVGHPYYADYNASKAGVILLTRSMALELAPQVRVNCVAPGYVMTPMQRAEYTPEMLQATNRKIPLGRHALPEEIAALFAFLASDDAGYITGAVIPIDAGETAGGLASRDWILPSGTPQ
ncbi:MAG TPA: SDR family oxidoreductase [Chloroflexota bacterium]|nr:SDR family oxidoreductase [Chloroflexota bacterium]